MSLTIQENFCWMLSYWKLHVNQALCGILKNILSQMSEVHFQVLNYVFTYMHVIVSKVRKILASISCAQACEGNSDVRFLALPNIYKNTLKDASSKLKFNTQCTHVFTHHTYSTCVRVESELQLVTQCNMT